MQVFAALEMFEDAFLRIVTGDVALILNDSVAVYSRKGIVSAFLMVSHWALRRRHYRWPSTGRPH